MQPQDELSSSFDTDEDFGWVSYFLTLKGNELFCQVDDEYIQDKVIMIIYLCTILIEIPLNV